MDATRLAAEPKVDAIDCAALFEKGVCLGALDVLCFPFHKKGVVLLGDVLRACIERRSSMMAVMCQ